MTNRPRLTRMRIVSVVACLLAASMALAQSPQRPQVAAVQLFQKAQRAAETLTYVGVREVEFRVEGNRVRNIEIITADGGRSRTEYGVGSAWAGQVVIERDGRRYHFFPQTNEIHVLPPRRDESRQRLMRMMDGGPRGGLRMTLAPGTDVAGRPTTLLTLKDREGNSLQRLWVDRETALPLRRELVGPLGDVVGRFEFTRVNFRPRIDPADFEWQRRGATVLNLRDLLRRAARQAGVRPYRLPPDGAFRLEAVRVIRLPEGAGLAQTYFGPAGRVTLFQVPGPVDPERLQRLAGAGLNVHVWTEGTATLALVGDVDAGVLRRLAERVLL